MGRSLVSRGAWAGLLIGAMALGACVPVELPAPQPQSDPVASAPKPAAEASARAFVGVVEDMEPVIERECRARAPGLDCDFQIVVDTRAGLPPNAYQTLDRNNRPLIAFTTALIADVENADEVAFILGHEAAHHINGHLARTQQNAVAGAVFGTILAGVLGADASGIDAATELGATVGARSYSKDFELEADQLGTIITWRAGYNPERGARYFTRIPDPGNRFLGTHPPNAQRIETVRRTLATLR